MRHYCSLADSKYLPQLLALYESIRKHSSEPFTLWVLAMDEECRQHIVWLKDRIDYFTSDQSYLMECSPNRFAALRESRTYQEYCWTCASLFTQYVLEELNQPDVTYLDADMFFFADPTVIFDRIGDRSIGITPHYFPDQYKYLERNGKYCVSIVHFKNTEVGRKCLSHWAEQCREWCFYRNEGDRFGDQKYLDSWKDTYGDHVAEMWHDTALAPWNVTAYQPDWPYVTRAIQFSIEPARAGFVHTKQAIAYHFHEFLERGDGTFRLTNYPLRQEDIEFFYKPYIAAVTAAKERIASVGSVA